MKLLIYFVFAFSCLTLCAQDSGNVIPFQGQLANQAGQALSLTNAATLVFRIYRVPVGGVAIWEESQPNISVNAGRFGVLLGSHIELPNNTNFNNTLYLGITLDDGNPATADVEMRPRQAIVPVIAARYSQNADKLGGYDWSPLFGTNTPANGRIRGDKIQDKTIASTQISDGGITKSNLSQEVTGYLVPKGAIVMWSGLGGQIPSGWALCDGNSGTPNLTNKFVLSAGSLSDADQKGGSLTHDHGGSSGGHVLTVDEIPSHKHASWGESFASEAPWGVTGGTGHLGSSNPDRDNYFYYTSPVGNDQPHTHTIGPASHMPPYYTLAFIMKL